MSSEYSPAENKMIMCMTRELSCTPEKCLKCGWLKDDYKEWLNQAQEKWLKEQK